MHLGFEIFSDLLILGCGQLFDPLKFALRLLFEHLLLWRAAQGLTGFGPLALLNQLGQLKGCGVKICPVIFDKGVLHQNRSSSELANSNNTHLSGLSSGSAAAKI